MTQQIHSSSLAVYTRAQIMALEQLALVQQGLTAELLMERAGAAAWAVLLKKWPNTSQIAVMCGAGNNGGDGYVLALLAHRQGLSVTVCQLSATEYLKGAALQAALACEKAGVLLQPFSEKFISQADVVVDAMLGTGLRGEIKEAASAIIDAINFSDKPVLAIDIPSGLIVDTGQVGEKAILATATITFIGLKVGLLTGKGPAYSGEVFCAELDLGQDLFKQVPPTALCLDQQTIIRHLPPRRRDAHKGDFGHVLVIGGDYGMAGAVRLASEAAARVGAGLVTVITRAEHVAIVSSMRPEMLCYGVENSAQLEKTMARASVIVLGPGLGQSDWSQQLFNTAIASELPMVVDADALNLLARMNRHNPNWILTPHPGEASRLLDCTIQNIQADRVAAVQGLQLRYGGICVLKGAGSLIKGPNTLAICTDGNPGMASGGMGDVLSGTIGGLLAQGLSLEQAAQSGVLIHACAADRAALIGERGLLALDLLPEIRRLVNFD